MTIALTGTGIQPEIGAIPSSAPFGNVAVGNTNSQTITLSNGGTANLIISQGSVSGNGFKITGLSTPMTITPGSNTTFNAVFTPTGAGKVTGSISLANDATNSPYTIALSGTGVAETQLLSFNVPSLSFGNVSVGSNSESAGDFDEYRQLQRDNLLGKYYGCGLHGKRRVVRREFEPEPIDPGYRSICAERSGCSERKSDDSE